jgi:hypothetical protein
MNLFLFLGKDRANISVGSCHDYRNGWGFYQVFLKHHYFFYIDKQDNLFTVSRIHGILARFLIRILGSVPKNYGPGPDLYQSS